MNYYLSSSDVSVLKKTINTVNNLTGATPKNQKPVIKNAFAYAELIEEDTNGLWSAKEVYFDETGTPNELTNGRTWGGENPSVIINGTVSAGQVVRIEAYYLVDSSDEEQAVWVGSAIGGGSSIVWLKIKSKVDQKNYIADVYEYPNDPNPPSSIDVPVYFYNVNYGEIPINNFYHSQLVGSIYYAYAPTWGG